LPRENGKKTAKEHGNKWFFFGVIPIAKAISTSTFSADGKNTCYLFGTIIIHLLKEEDPYVG